MAVATLADIAEDRLKLRTKLVDFVLQKPTSDDAARFQLPADQRLQSRAAASRWLRIRPEQYHHCEVVRSSRTAWTPAAAATTSGTGSLTDRLFHPTKHWDGLESFDDVGNGTPVLVADFVARFALQQNVKENMSSIQEEDQLHLSTIVVVTEFVVHRLQKKTNRKNNRAVQKKLKKLERGLL